MTTSSPEHLNPESGDQPQKNKKDKSKKTVGKLPAIDSYSPDSLPKRKKIRGESKNGIHPLDGMPIDQAALAAEIDSLSIFNLREYYRLTLNYLGSHFYLWQDMVERAGEVLEEIDNGDEIDPDQDVVAQAEAEDSMSFVEYLLTLPTFQQFKRDHHWETNNDLRELMLTIMPNCRIFRGNTPEMRITTTQAEIVDEMFDTSLTQQLAESMRKKPRLSKLVYYADLQITNGYGEVVKAVDHIKISVRPDMSPKFPDIVFISTALAEMAEFPLPAELANEADQDDQPDEDDEQTNEDILEIDPEVVRKIEIEAVYTDESSFNQSA